MTTTNHFSRIGCVLTAALACSLAAPGGLRADAPGPAAALVKLLGSGRLPAERQGPVAALVCQRGDAAELAYVFGLCVRPGGLAPVARGQALEALAEAARTRKLRPDGDLTRLRALLGDDARVTPAERLVALRLAGLWKAAPLRPDVEAVALAPATPPALREAALEGLVLLSGKESLAVFKSLAGPDRPPAVRSLGVTALARTDPEAAAGPAAELLEQATEPDQVTGVLGAFLDARGGSDRLAAALARRKLTPDAAKLALRGVYAAGRSDAALVKALGDAAGLDSGDRVLGKAEIESLLAGVRERGDAARGERVFRRADLNCTKCHSLAGAGGVVGPDLGAVGSTSPADYLLRSVLYPDESIKEEYLTVVVTTADGKLYQGVVVEDGADRLVLRDAAGVRKSIAKLDIEDRQKGGSLMPKGLANLMTRAELVDLVRFLSELGRSPAYPVQTAPIVRRWRLLSPDESALTREVPDEDTFRKLVLGADAAAWRPVYSRHDGSLPLADLTSGKGPPVVYLQAEFEVKAAGQVGLQVDADDGLDAWLDERTLPVNKTTVTEAEVGRRRLTFRIDRARRKAAMLRVELTKPDGSEAEAAVVGGP